LEESDFDTAMRSIEEAADRVDETASGSVQKKAKDRGENLRWNHKNMGFKL